MENITRIKERIKNAKGDNIILSIADFEAYANHFEGNNFEITYLDDANGIFTDPVVSIKVVRCSKYDSAIWKLNKQISEIEFGLQNENNLVNICSSTSDLEVLDNTIQKLKNRI